MVFHSKNRGLASARNLGLEYAKGDYISYIDSDDWIELNTMEELLNAPISELELSQRSTHCMQRNNIFTIGDLAAKTTEEIMGFRNLGAKSFKEICDRLAERGLSLKSGSSVD